MPDILLNQELAEILTAHGVEITADDEFIYADLPTKIKLKARAIYTEVNSCISSQMDVMIIPDTGEKILESFGDFGQNLESATRNNLSNFCMSSLHPLLVAFGSERQDVIEHITIEEWEIGGKIWTAYIGNLIPKTNSKNSLIPPPYFFDAIVTGICSQQLSNNLHWFRRYYLQHNDKIIHTEFMMDNNVITSSNPQFSSIPVIPNVEIYSCRNFIILRKS